MKALLRMIELSEERHGKTQKEFMSTDPRRHREVVEGRMVNEDHHAMANLPTEGYQVEYPPQYKDPVLKG